MDHLISRPMSPVGAWPTAWRGHWVGSARPSSADFAFAPAVEREPFNRAIFSTSFELAAGDHRGRLRLTADSRYALYVNGVEQGRGPVRSQPRRLTFDDYDIGPALHEGPNSITVVVTYYSQPNSFWQPAINNLSLGAGAVLALEAEIDGDWIVSDETWAVLAGAAWTIPPIEGLNGVPVERLDARLISEGWRTGPSEGSNGWRPAVVVPALHFGALARSTPPTDPYGPLSPRPIGPLGGDIVHPAAATSVRLERRTPIEHPARAVAEYLPAWSATSSEPVGDSVDVELRDDEAQHVWLDFGRIVCGFVRFEFDAPRGSMVDLAYREKAFDTTKEEESTAPAVGARYIARGTDDAFDAMESNGFRFAHLVLTGPGRVRLSGFRVQENLYPRRGDAFFRSSDPRLDALYQAGVRTTFLNSQDAFLDCPTREQRAWVGDGVVHQMVHLTTSSDWRLASWYVTLANSPRADGILPMSVVGDIEYGGAYTIPDWSLNWVHAVHNLYRYLGDKESLGTVLSTVRSVLRWYEAFQDETGIIADVPEWNLVDWSSVLTAGRSSILTALWARALREYAQMSRFVGNEGDAKWADDLWDKARGGYDQFWDEERGTYVDALDPRHPVAPTSQIAGAAAIASGLAPSERWDRIIDRITDSGRLVIRSWIGGNGGYDQERMNEQLNGIQRLDWDAHNEVVRAEPFMSYLVHDAIALAGRAAELPRALDAWHEFLVDGYDTFGECWGWGTPSHGWSSTPTRDIVQHLLGVTPDAPGFGRARIAPAFGAVDWMEGSAPTPSGQLTVRVDADTVSVDSPIPYVLVLPDREVEGLPGSTTFTTQGSIRA
jgi:alpha-L-rhamnosidase